MIEDSVILVDVNDLEIGTMEKLEAHQKGFLHRAFSIFIFNSKGEMLLQKRAAEKYHTGNLWSNSCCSHPLPGENFEICLDRKLMQEMGIGCSLEPAFTFTYKADLDNGLTEYELDHIYTGIYNGVPSPNPLEVSDWRFVSMKALTKELDDSPEQFTPWFRLLFEPLTRHYFLK